jgi:hypothetical protein
MATALTTVTAAIFSVPIVQTVQTLTALTASHKITFKITVTALVPIIVIFLQFLTTVTVLATALRLSVPSCMSLAIWTLTSG